MLEQSDRDLRDKVKAGRAYEADRNAIDADTIRRLVCSLPFEGEAGPSPTTSAGIVVRDAIVVGRIELDCAIGNGCCPVSIAFHDCDFFGGFSGVNGHFQSLCFDGCSFTNISGELAEPAINLADARIEGGLGLRTIHPGNGDGPLWINAANVRIAGPLDLSHARLRAPKPSESCDPSWPPKAIDLLGAEICGDVYFKGGESKGQVYARGIHIRGDLRMSGMSIAVARGFGLFLQSAVIEGMALLCDDRDPNHKRKFICRGDVSLRAAEIGDDLHVEGATIKGHANFLDLAVGNDLLFYASARHEVDLTGCRIGGTLDLSELRILGHEAKLLLVDGTIGRVLRLAIRKESGPAEKREPKPGEPLKSKFCVRGEVDLRGLSCDMLDDGDGALWKPHPRIQMNHFVYKRMGWRAEISRPKASHEVFGDWLRGKRAQGGAWRGIPKWVVSSGKDFWKPWQIRRNWIYQQFERRERTPDSIARHRVREHEYRPQPFEQVIRAARAEGDEDFATQFEMLKQRIEWRFFNLLVRRWLAFAAIGLASLWLLVNHGRGAGFWVDGWTYFWTLVALAATVLFMLYASTIRDTIARLMGREPSKAGSSPGRLTWVVFCVPAALLLTLLWWDRPFHFIVAFFIFVAIRWLGVMAHFVMRWGFGYLRRPVRAIITLILAFIVGWWGVHLANQRNMLVVAAAPVATIAGPDSNARYPGGYDARGTPALFGSRGGLRGLVRELSCAATISEPLYALDVLIPIVDLGEESRCEVRRVVDHHSHRSIVHPKSLGLWEMFWALPDLPLNDHRFWWWAKALYAIAGWFIVSLSILTFAQVNRTHAEPPHEHK